MASFGVASAPTSAGALSTFCGAHPLGAPRGLQATAGFRKISIQHSERVWLLPTPRAVAAGGGWMNVDQPDELSEGL